MRRITFTLLSTMVLWQAHSQDNEINRKSIFTDDRPIEVSLTTDIRNLMMKKKEPEFQQATVTFKFPDSDSVIKEKIEVKPRGEYRKNNCNIASLMLNFKTPDAPQLSSLKRLKFVGACGRTTLDEQTVIKEYLAYKLYNLFTEMSFRVRLLRVEYNDSRGKFKSYSQYAFLIEDVDDMAKRNGCREKEDLAFHTEQTMRDQMTMVGIFQYMIANPDWSVPNYHNIKLMVPKEDTLAMPYVVPYDFDCSGFVNAHYAVPPDGLDIASVTDRLYRGFPRTMEEIQKVINLFIERKEKVMGTINNCSYSLSKEKKEMTSFIEDFYKGINKSDYLRANFIENARKN